MPRLNKTQTYAILWLNNQGHDPTDIAKELDIQKNQVLNTISKNTVNTGKNNLQTASAPASNKYKTKDLMITDTASKTRKVAIMTKEASEINDSFKKNIPNAPSRKNDKNIFRPLDNK